MSVGCQVGAGKAIIMFPSYGESATRQGQPGHPVSRQNTMWFRECRASWIQRGTEPDTARINTLKLVTSLNQCSVKTPHNVKSK